MNFHDELDLLDVAQNEMALEANRMQLRRR